jgi:hypothetical protein
MSNVECLVSRHCQGFGCRADVRREDGWLAELGVGAKFAELVEASALRPGRGAIKSKIVPNPCALIISPLHSRQDQIFFAVTSRTERLRNAIDREPQVERKTVRINQLPIHRF